MQKMGYVFGTGLGPKAEGRIEPVTAVILPPGKSLGKKNMEEIDFLLIVLCVQIIAWS